MLWAKEVRQDIIEANPDMGKLENHLIDELL